MTLGEFRRKTKTMEDDTILCVPDLMLGNEGEVANLEVSYITEGCTKYIDVHGNKHYNMDIVTVW